MAKETEDTFDKLKAGAKAVGKKVTDPGKDIGEEYEKEKQKESAGEYGQTRDYSQSEGGSGKEPMSPEKIASHESTAVKRDRNQPSTGEPV
jgi:hypothetical protein